MATETAIEKRESQDVQSTERVRAGQTYIPNVDIVENDTKLLLLADLPGVKSEDLEVRYERGELTIHAQVRPRQDPEQIGYLLREYPVGDYARTFQVGEGIDADKIEADLKDGVLTLHLPKSQKVLPRRIKVNS